MKLRFEPVQRLCEAAVGDGAAPGFVVLVAAGGEVQFRQAFGSRQLTPRTLRAHADTVYDLASLTKALVTSVLAMGQVQSGALFLNEPVAARIPDLDKTDRLEITARQLLCH